MSDHSKWGFRIKDILHCIERIELIVNDVNYDIFESSENDQDVVLRRFQIIGEATRKLPDEIKDRHPDIPWKKMIDFRNFVVHEYHRINYRIIWDTALIELPKIKDALLKIKLPEEE